MSAATKKRLTLTKAEVAAIHRFLWGRLIEQSGPPLNNYAYRGITRDQYWQSYPSWIRGGNAWNTIEQGGTGIMAALCWYHHIHKPGSREWRPSIIIRALLQVAQEPARG